MVSVGLKQLTAIYAALFFLLFLWLGLTEPGAELLHWLHGQRGLDKVGHFLVMGIFSLLLNLSLSATRVRVGPVSILAGTLIVMAISVVEELAQNLFRERVFSLIDLAADLAGAYCFGLLAAYLVARRQQLPTRNA